MRNNKSFLKKLASFDGNKYLLKIAVSTILKTIQKDLNQLNAASLFIEESVGSIKFYKKNKKDKNTGHEYSRGLFFKNYDLYGSEKGSETSPGTGLYQYMDEYKSTKDFLNKKRKSNYKPLYEEKSDYNIKNQKVKSDSFKRNASYFQKIAGDIFDLSKKLEEKKQQQEKENTLKELSESLSSPFVETKPEKIINLEQREFLKQVQESPNAGAWMHPFAQVHKDEDGFFILKSENPAGNKIRIGDLISDYAINLNPYWSVKSIKGNRINLEPIGQNPFKTGVGAGGAKITSYDIDIFSGKYEEERRAKALASLNSGNADIDDVKYLLLGTVPTQMGPNGAQGGWYNPSDTYSNRGGKLRLSSQQIIQQDAQQLKDWGFKVPKKALDGTIDKNVWSNWIEGNPTARELEEYETEEDSEEINNLKKQILESKDRRFPRIAIEKLLKLIKDGEQSDDILLEIINDGGSPDYYTNEKIIYYYNNNKNIDAIRLCIEKLPDEDNKSLCYMKLAELDPSSIEDLLKIESSMKGLYRGFSELKSINQPKGIFMDDLKNPWAVNFIKDNNIIEKIKSAIAQPLSYSDKYTLEDFLASMLKAFGRPYFWDKPRPGTPEITEEDKEMYNEIDELYNKVKNIKISNSRKLFFTKLANNKSSRTSNTNHSNYLFLI